MYRRGGQSQYKMRYAVLVEIKHSHFMAHHCLPAINENVKINFNPLKYRSIIGRNHIIIRVIKDLRDSIHINQFIIIYGKAGLEKLNFAGYLGFIAVFYTSFVVILQCKKYYN